MSHTSHRHHLNAWIILPPSLHWSLPGLPLQLDQNPNSRVLQWPNCYVSWPLLQIFYHLPCYLKSSSLLKGHLSFPQIQLTVYISRSLHLFVLLPRICFSEISAWFPISHYLGLPHTSSPSNTLAKELSAALINPCSLTLTCFLLCILHFAK